MIPNLKVYNEALERMNREKHRMHRRARWHDYHSKRIYMVTIMKMPGIPPFSSVQGQINDGTAVARALNSPLGRILGDALRALPERFAEVKVIQYIFMPDHVHILIEITTETPYHFSNVISYFKRDCSLRYQGYLAHKHDFEFSGNVFTNGYHDRILSEDGQLRILIDYIRDNPRRYFLKQSYPEFFRNKLLLLTHFGQFSIYGNPMLLEHFHKVAVRFSSKYEETKVKELENQWDEAIRAKGVLVSPFIHKREKEYLKRSLDEGARLIIIQPNGFPERWKPERRFMEACAEGRLLFVGPTQFYTSEPALSRDLCIKMNGIAAEICAMKRKGYCIKRSN